MHLYSKTSFTRLCFLFLAAPALFIGCKDGGIKAWDWRDSAPKTNEQKAQIIEKPVIDPALLRPSTEKTVTPETLSVRLIETAALGDWQAYSGFLKQGADPDLAYAIAMAVEEDFEGREEALERISGNWGGLQISAPLNITRSFLLAAQYRIGNEAVLETLDLLERSGADPKEALILATAQDNRVAVQEICRYAKSEKRVKDIINQNNPDSLTHGNPLRTAVVFGNFEIVQALLANEASPELEYDHASKSEEGLSWLARGSYTTLELLDSLMENAEEEHSSKVQKKNAPKQSKTDHFWAGRTERLKKIKSLFEKLPKTAL